MRARVNLLTRHAYPLYTQHIGAQFSEKVELVENGDGGDWDLAIVFEGMSVPAALTVREGGLVFVSGEPPEIGIYPPGFLAQFDRVYSAKPGRHPDAVRIQHFNNWHFGYNGSEQSYRYDHAALRALPIPEKTRDISVVTSNLSYLPNHFKRLRLIERFRQRFGERIDFFGRPHRFVEYKDEALLPYRFHLCFENSGVPGLWTEKIADPILGYAVPIYAGAPDIEKFFPGAVIRLDLDDPAAAEAVVANVLDHAEEIYQARLPALIEARRRLIEEHDLTALILAELGRVQDASPRTVRLAPPQAFADFNWRELGSRMHRRMRTLATRAAYRLRGW